MELVSAILLCFAAIIILLLVVGIVYHYKVARLSRQSGLEAYNHLARTRTRSSSRSSSTFDLESASVKKWSPSRLLTVPSVRFNQKIDSLKFAFNRKCNTTRSTFGFTTEVSQLSLTILGSARQKCQIARTAGCHPASFIMEIFQSFTQGHENSLKTVTKGFFRSQVHQRRKCFVRTSYAG
jgi:hypothetical protein